VGNNHVLAPQGRHGEERDLIRPEAKETPASLRQVTSQWPPSGEIEANPPIHSPEKHLVIAGTGRAGTSFLVRYLTELGLDTTLARNGNRAEWNAEADAGLEDLLFPGKDLPYVIKSPWISEYVDQILSEKQFRIDAFIVPVRDLVEAATSRVVLEQRAIHQTNLWMAELLNGTWETYGHTPGGVVFSLSPVDQARLLAVQFHRLVLKLSEAEIPFVFPVFPRIATDWEYLYKCLRPILPPQINEGAARAAHAKVADAAKVRVTSEIVSDARSDVMRPREPKPKPHYPTPIEVDNIALRREIGRVRLELRQRLSVQETVKAAKLEFEQERTSLQATIQGLRHKLERKSIKYKIRRVLRFLNGPRAVAIEP
jgi:hypothetical protein